MSPWKEGTEVRVKARGQLLYWRSAQFNIATSLKKLYKQQTFRYCLFVWFFRRLKVLKKVSKATSATPPASSSSSFKLFRPSLQEQGLIYNLIESSSAYCSNNNDKTRGTFELPLPILPLPLSLSHSQRAALLATLFKFPLWSSALASRGWRKEKIARQCVPGLARGRGSSSSCEK